MSVTKTTTITALGGILVVDLDANASAEENVTGNSSGTLYSVDIDNTQNTSDAVYLRIRDAATADPANASNGLHNWLLPCLAGQSMSYLMPSGTAYASGLSVWCTTDPALTNTDSPTNAVIVRLVAS
jgi:hypothetical protein